MSDTAIRTESLSKSYRIVHNQERQRYKTLREDLLSLPRRALAKVRGLRSFQETFWALQDISFEVKEGDVLGIIGHNGAGKSTLLKILSRITEPTKGRAEVYGRVGALLEVGTGFHPELTGRENIFLNGALLGIRRHDIARRFEEIVAFAEVERFIDMPVKHYSSGMFMRLAFAVAAHLDAEIVLIDEVLAVGDAAFQQKCLGKMNDVATEGRTVLFVTHNMAAVQSLCRRVIWVHGGRIVEDGPTGVVVSDYLTKSVVAANERVWDDVPTAPGNDTVRLHRACIRLQGGSPSEPITIRTPLVMEFEYWNLEPNAYLHVTVHLYNEQGITVFETFPLHERVWHGRPFPVGLFRSECYIPGDLLNNGMHRVQLLVVKNGAVVIYRHDDILAFDVLDSVEMRGDWHGEWAGTVRPNLQWRTEFIQSDPLLIPHVPSHA